MFIGHLGAGLALKRLQPRLNLGLLLFASLVLDALLSILVLSGVESVIIPDNYASLHYLRFVFPYSHSLLGALVVTAVVFSTTLALFPADRRDRLKAASAMGGAVLIHWIGDWIEHPRQLPLTPASRWLVGLSLWDSLGYALALELALAAAGTWLYLRATRSSGRKRRWGVVVLVGVLTAMAVIGQATAVTAPPPTGLALSWIGQTAVICGLVAWFDMPRREALAA